MQFDPSLPAELIDYYYTNYTKCPKDTSYFSTWQFLATFAHSLMAIQVPLVVFTGYCILRKTPKEMGTLKWAMLNVHIWSSYMDIYLCSLATPYIFFPTLGGFPVGLLRALGAPTSVQTFTGIVSIGVMFSSIAALFENRSSSFQLNRFRFESNLTRLVFFVANCVVFAVFLIPVFLNIPDQNLAKRDSLNFLICPTEEYFSSPVFFLTAQKLWSYYLAGVLATEFIIMMAVALFFVICITYHMFFSINVNYSASTRKLQRMFFAGNLIQIVIPAAFYAIPALSIATFWLLKYHNQSITNIGICFVSFHGLASMIVVLSIHRPYRVYVLNLLGKREAVSTQVLSAANTISHSEALLVS